MQTLEIPQYEHKLKKINNILYIYDVIRKKYIMLTPEEWVRQQFVRWLLEKHQYPKSLMKVESGLKYNTRQKRTDIVVYNRDGQPFLLVECKSMNVTLSQDVTEQAARYNFVLKANYLAVTNGYYYQVFEIDHSTKQYTPLTDIPVFG